MSIKACLMELKDQMWNWGMLCPVNTDGFYMEYKHCWPDPTPLKLVVKLFLLSTARDQNSSKKLTYGIRPNHMHLYSQYDANSDCKGRMNGILPGKVKQEMEETDKTINMQIKMFSFRSEFLYTKMVKMKQKRLNMSLKSIGKVIFKGMSLSQIQKCLHEVQ